MAAIQRLSSCTTTNPVWDAYETARDNRVRLRCWDSSRYAEYTWDEWRRHAERIAVGLRSRGIEQGTRVAAVLTNTFDVCATVVGTWLAGGTLLSLPVLRRGQGAEEYMEQLKRLCQQSEADLLLLEGRFLDLFGSERFGPPVVNFEALAADGPLDPTPPADDDVAFVQYSSGSTSDPKGCMLTMGAIAEQERMLCERLAPDERMSGVMWLPLSHDMGLFGGLLLSWVTGMAATIGTPERFLQQPTTWFDDCAAFGANITVGPSFGLALATRRARSRPPRGRIPLRALVLGGERIEWDALHAADELLGPHGIGLDVMVPAYGLAEAALAVTMKRPGGASPTVRVIEANAMYRGDLLPAAGADDDLTLVSCGPPVDGASVRIEGDGPLGRVCVRSASMTTGYLGDETLTRRALVDGELVTGDVGFIQDGELFVVGRTDDVITLGGRNIFARDAERLVERCDGVRPGCVALIDLPAGDRPSIVLVVESRSEASGRVQLAREMAAATFRAVGLRVEECVFLAPGSLPKTPSGKVQRFRCRSLLHRAGEAIVDRVEL